jgi:hypothetical protein
MLYAMGKNIIVSEETLRDLLEAHASLSAWYYELWAGLRAAKATAGTPDDAARAAFVERLATDFPELASVARSIRVPRMYVPAPPPFPTQPMGREEIATIIEPAQARAKLPSSADQELGSAASGEVQAPPLVDPGRVKYEP